MAAVQWLDSCSAGAFLTARTGTKKRTCPLTRTDAVKNICGTTLFDGKLRPPHRMPTHPKPFHAGYASRHTGGPARPFSARPRRSICRFAAIGLSAIDTSRLLNDALCPGPNLCACAAGLISASTVLFSIACAFRDCKEGFCIFYVFLRQILPAGKQNGMMITADIRV